MERYITDQDKTMMICVNSGVVGFVHISGDGLSIKCTLQNVLELIEDRHNYNEMLNEYTLAEYDTKEQTKTAFCMFLDWLYRDSEIQLFYFPVWDPEKNRMNPEWSCLERVQRFYA